MVVLCRRRLRHTDRIGGWKGLFQPLLERLFEPTFFGALGAFPSGPRCAHAYSPGPVPRNDVAGHPSMLDDVSISRIQEGRGRMKHITCIEDLRLLHKRRVPKAFFDYADRGSYAEETLRANREDLQQVKLRQRILVDVSRRDMKTNIIGEPSALPLVLAPVGLLGMQHGDGEIHACRAAQAAGIPFTQSTMSICSIED